MKNNYFDKKITKLEKEKIVSTSLEKFKILSNEINSKYEEKIIKKDYIKLTSDFE